MYTCYIYLLYIFIYNLKKENIRNNNTLKLIVCITKVLMSDSVFFFLKVFIFYIFCIYFGGHFIRHIQSLISWRISCHSIDLEIYYSPVILARCITLWICHIFDLFQELKHLKWWYLYCFPHLSLLGKIPNLWIVFVFFIVAFCPSLYFQS